MSETYQYTPVALARISETLTRSMGEMSQGVEKFATAGTVNSVVAVSAGFDVKGLEDLITTLSLVHPNRTFVFVSNDKETTLGADFAALCHRVSQHEHVCSEVVRLKGSPRDLSSALSVLRANLLTGMPTELVLFDPIASLETLKPLSSLSESIIFQSSIFEGQFESAKTLLSTQQALVDLEWVKLGVWRDQVKDLFDNRKFCDYLPSLSQISIGYMASKSVKKLPAAALLMAGWFAGRLSARVSKISPNLVSFWGAQGSKFDIAFIKEGEAAESGQSSLTLNFTGATSESSGNIKIKQEQAELVSTIDLDGHFRTTRPIEDQSRMSLMKRFFFIGESTLNYSQSLKFAIEIASKAGSEG